MQITTVEFLLVGIVVFGFILTVVVTKLAK